MTANGQKDLIVVGSGVAGLSAAVSALESGLSVTIIERAPPEDFGGNSRWTDAYVRMKSDSAISDDFEETFATNAGANLDPNLLIAASDNYDDWPDHVRAHPFADPELIARFAEGVVPTISWLKGFGLRFEPLPIYHLTQNTTRLAANGGGLAIIERLAEEARKLGADIRYRTTATDLLQDADGVVTGVVVADPERRRRNLNASATLLACGGFQGNLEMTTRYIGSHACNIRPVARGGYYNKGEGIRMALAIGAAPAGDFASYHAEPMDPRSRQPGPVVFIYPYGVILNKEGRRFLDEAPGTSDASYDNITREIGRQRDGISYVIFDSKVEEIPNWRTSIRSEVPPCTAPTLRELFGQLELPPEVAMQAIEEYNSACPKNDADYDPLKPDGLSTQGLLPKKTNWSRTIDAAPFMAFPVMAGNCFTFGGVKVNGDAQVVDCDGKTIPGLYAAGETMGLYHQVYTGSTSVLRGLVFGRRAALHAAGRQRRN